MQPYVIGIDIGTGSTKAVALDYSGVVIATAQVYYSTQFSQPGYAEQDAVTIWQAFTKCIQEVIAALDGAPAYISLSSCMHSIMAVNKECQPLTPLISWADTRSASIADELRQSPEGESIYTCTGTPLHSMSPLCKIIWLHRNQKEVFNSVFKFISIKEYIWYQLFGVYEVDYSIASATGLFNIQTLQWHAASLQKCHITNEHLSHAVPASHQRNGLTSEAAALISLADVAFCIGASDGCLANVGTHAIKKGVAALTIGTSGAVRIAHTEPIINYEAMTFNYKLDNEIFICGGPVNNGGNVVQWLFKSLFNNKKPADADYENLYNTIATIPAGCDGLLCLPYFMGERAPIWDEKSSGVFIGVRAHHTQAFFARAALEGVCFALYNVLQVLESATGPVRQLNVSGGFIQSKAWMQMLADITGKPLWLVQTEDASAIGAALLCMKEAGVIDHYLAFNQGTPEVITPCAEKHLLYQKQFAIFKNLYGILKEPMHQLHPTNN
jgi:gluconokinase